MRPCPKCHRIPQVAFGWTMNKMLMTEIMFVTKCCRRTTFQYSEIADPGVLEVDAVTDFVDKWNDFVDSQPKRTKS